MNPEIIPTNFALDKETFDKKLKRLSFSKKIHIDFMDGKFTNNKSIEIKDMTSILKYPNIIFEIHLMALNPEKYLHEIKSLNIKKVLIQEEVFNNKEDIKKAINTFKKNDLELFIVLNPETSIKRIKSYIKDIDGIMIMSVNPGAEGQKFIEHTYEKIREIRDFVSEKYIIQIDGGISIKNTRKLITNSANILSIGSYISNNDNPKKQYISLIKAPK